MGDTSRSNRVVMPIGVAALLAAGVYALAGLTFVIEGHGSEQQIGLAILAVGAVVVGWLIVGGIVAARGRDTLWPLVIVLVPATVEAFARGIVCALLAKAFAPTSNSTFGYGPDFSSWVPWLAGMSVAALIEVVALGIAAHGSRARPLTPPTVF